MTKSKFSVPFRLDDRLAKFTVELEIEYCTRADLQEVEDLELLGFKIFKEFEGKFVKLFHEKLDEWNEELKQKAASGEEEVGGGQEDS